MVTGIYVPGYFGNISRECVSFTAFYYTHPMKERNLKMMRRLTAALLSLVLVLALCACGASAPAQSAAPAAERLQFRVGMECAYAPSNWQEDAPSGTNYPIENVPGGYAEGYDVQIAKAIADGLDRELVIVKMSWSGLIEALNQGQIDAIIAGMADTAERRESINFSDPYHVTEYGIMVNSGSAYEGAASIQDFSGASVLGQKDTQLDTVIDQMEGVNHLTPVDSVPNMISRLAQGTCDALVVNLESTDSYLASNPNFVVISFEEGKGFDLGFSGSCVGLRKEDNDLLAGINAVLATIPDEERDALWATAVENQPK